MFTKIWVELSFRWWLREVSASRFLSGHGVPEWARQNHQFNWQTRMCNGNITPLWPAPTCRYNTCVYVHTCTYTYMQLRACPLSTDHALQIVWMYIHTCTYTWSAARHPVHDESAPESFLLTQEKRNRSPSLFVSRTRNDYINHVPRWSRQIWWWHKSAIESQTNLLRVPSTFQRLVDRKMRTSALVALVAALIATSSDALGLLKRNGPSSFDRPIYFDLKRRAFLQPRAEPKVLSLEVRATVKLKSINSLSSHVLIVAE